MPVKQLTPEMEILRYQEQQIQRLEQSLCRTLSYVGEQCVNMARSLPSPSFDGFARKDIPMHQPNYIDWTDNLRSSIGYVLVKDGQIIKASTFEVVGSGTEGAKEGKAYTEKLAREYTQVIALIVVAGMRYAAYVSAKGYDVIDSAELLADQLVPRLLKQLGFRF